ncbi:hypothetical protein [Kitasatospora sp. MBT63]|uniref:hypothetical protein n=1 Tax=Kitasatospora sp. MBT63 TaxID=1444768 RepID=UPI000691BBEE|nr:hypothetical protein [Kitasatospora sp. MBT63]
MLSKRLAATAVVCSALVLGASGCGPDKAPAVSAESAAASATSAASKGAGAAGHLDTDKLTAAEIEKQAHDAMASLSSVKVSGNLVAEGQKMKLDLATDTKGNCQGTIAIADLGQIEIIHTGGTSFLKPDAAFWKSIAGGQGNPQAGAMAAELFKGRYLTGAKDDPELAGLADMCDLVKSMTDSDDTSDGAVKGAATTVNGVKTFTVVSTDDDGSKTTAYIATEGKPYLVKMSHDGAEPGEMNFSDFDKPVTVQAPSADNVIDYSQFKAKLTSA